MNNKPNNVIQVTNLSKSFGKVQAVHGISFTVQKGEIFGLLGPNGAGKTTTLSILEGLIRADFGQVSVLGLDITRNVNEIKRQIGVQLQTTSLLPELTVYDQIQLFGKLYGVQLNKDEVYSLLKLVGLTDKASNLPTKLSGGQQQRLALAIALINQPEVIFLDEPTNGLDPQSRRALWDIVRQLQIQGKTIVLTTHYMDEAQNLCDRVGIIDHGKIVALDSPSVLINKLAGFSTITILEKFSIDEIKSLSEIKNIHVDGSYLHLQTDNIPKTLRAILDIAEGKNLAIDNLQIKQPNLEEVFLNLTGRMIRN